ncbi:hypothetical protein VNO78_36388 [Psophocarpus tetragonolobus]
MDDRATLILLLTSPPSHLKGEVAEASRCSGRALSFLCSIESYQTRLTSDQPVVKLDQVRRMNLYLCTVRKLLAGGRSTVRAQYSGGWFRFDKGRMPGRRSSTVGSRRVRFGSRARTINRRCTILAAMYVNLDLRDSSNGTHTQRRTTSSGLDETENISIKKLTYWG